MNPIKLYREFRYFLEWKARRAAFYQRLDRVRSLELMRYSPAEIYEAVRGYQREHGLNLTADEVGHVCILLEQRTMRGRVTITQALDALMGKRGRP